MLILASQSPRRKQLLEWAEIKFEVMVANTDESYPSNLAIADVPVFIAREKAKAITANLTDNNKKILAADTIVVINDEIIGKPESREQAIEFLQKLSDNQHQVITGVVIIDGIKEIAFSDTTTVTFHPLTKNKSSLYR